MKKNILIVLFIFCASLTFAMSAFKKTNKAESITGYIHVYGNEPFTFIGIETEDDKQYSLKADEEILKDLRKAQGYKIEIKGKVQKEDKLTLDGLKDGNLIVIEWKFVK